MLSFGLLVQNSLLQYFPCVTPAVVFDYSKANWEGLCNYLLDQDFGICCEDKDVEQIWCKIKQVVILAMNIYIPKVRLRKHQSPNIFHLIYVINTSA